MLTAAINCGLAYAAIYERDMDVHKALYADLATFDKNDRLRLVKAAASYWEDFNSKIPKVHPDDVKALEKIKKPDIKVLGSAYA